MPKNNTNQSACLGFIDIVPFGTLPGLWGILWGPNGALSAPKTVFFYRCKTPQWPVRAEMGLNLISVDATDVTCIWLLSYHFGIPRDILLDSSTFSAVENILQKMGIIWTTSKKKKEIFCLDPTNVIMEKMNIGLAQNYALTDIHSVSREINDMPSKLTPEMLQSVHYKFGTLKTVGIPLPICSFPSSQLVFAALKDTEDYWTFLKETKYDRQIESDCLVGIIMSALLSKL